MTLGELHKWMRVRHWGGKSRQALADWISEMPVLQGDESVGVTWGGLAASAQERGRTRPGNDLWIASCCLAYDLPLATLNVKDYQDIVDHHGLRLITNG